MTSTNTEFARGADQAAMVNSPRHRLGMAAVDPGFKSYSPVTLIPGPPKTKDNK